MLQTCFFAYKNIKKNCVNYITLDFTGHGWAKYDLSAVSFEVNPGTCSQICIHSLQLINCRQNALVKEH